MSTFVVHRLRWAALACALLTLVSCTGDRTSVASGDPDSGEEEFTAPNGLHVRLLPDPGSGLVASNVFVGAGSTREDDTTAGASHFLEHLLFNGTTSRTQEALYAEVDRLGAYNNATTRQEYTHFMMVAPSENFDAALEVQADMLLHSILPEEKFEKERGIVLEELSKDQDDPDYRRERRIAELLHGESGDFSRPVLGTVESIRGLDRERVLEYYRRQYVPSNMRVVVMGDFEPGHVRARLLELFDAGAGDPRAAPRWPAPTDARLHQRAYEDDALTVLLELPAPSPGEEGYAPMALLVHVLAGNDGARIQQRLAQEPALEVKELSADLLHREGTTLLRVQARLAVDTDPDAVLERIFSELATVAEYGVGAREWSQARTVALASAIREVEQLHYYALLRGDRIWHSPAGFEARHQRALEESYQRMTEVAREWLGAPSPHVVVLGPGLEDRELEFDPVAEGWIPRADVTPPSPLPGDGILEERPPVVTEIQRPSVTVLNDGMTVVHAATPSTRMFALHLLVRDRSAREPRDHEGMADLLHRCLPQGAGIYDREEFAALLDGIGAELKVTDTAFIPYDDYYTTPEFSFVRLDCVDLYWREALRLLGLMLGEAQLDQDAVDRARTEILDRVRETGARPSDASRQRLHELLYPDHPLSARVFGKEGSLQDVDPRALRGFALDYLDPGQLVLAVVGNIDRAAVLEHIERSFDLGRASDHVKAEVGPPPLTETSLRDTQEVGGRQASLRMGRVVEIEPDDRWALAVAVMVASERMQQDLRETRGLAYSLGLSLDVHGEDRATVLASIGTRPENLEEVESAVRAVMEQGRVEAEVSEIAAAVNGYLGRMRMRRVTRLGQAYNLSHDLVFGGGLDFARRESAGLRAVEPKDVARVSERYLGSGPLVTVVAR